MPPETDSRQQDKEVLEIQRLRQREMPEVTLGNIFLPDLSSRDYIMIYPD